VSSRISNIEIRNKHRHYERKEFFLCPPATDHPSFVRRGQGR
jgi:hypothetical protein